VTEEECKAFVAELAKNLNEKDLEQAARSLSGYFEKQTVAIAVTLAELRGESREFCKSQGVESSAELMELARGIEPPTCGLQNSEKGLLKSLTIWAIPPSFNPRAYFLPV
jgi:hypothetical protein